MRYLSSGSDRTGRSVLGAYLVFSRGKTRRVGVIRVTLGQILRHDASSSAMPCRLHAGAEQAGRVIRILPGAPQNPHNSVLQRGSPTGIPQTKRNSAVYLGTVVTMARCLLASGYADEQGSENLS